MIGQWQAKTKFYDTKPFRMHDKSFVNHKYHPALSEMSKI